MNIGFRQSLSSIRYLFLPLFLAWLSPTPPAAAQSCLPGFCTGDLTAGQCGINDTFCTGSPNNYTPPSPCAGNGCNFVHNCRLPTVDNGSIEVLPGGNGTFIARLKMDVLVPWNKWAQTQNPNGTLDMHWFNTATVPSQCATNFSTTICEYLGSDHTQCWLQQTGLTCDGAPYNFGTYSFRAETCGGGCFCEQNPQFCTCWRKVDRNNLAFVVTKGMLGCPTPRKWPCDECKNRKDAGDGSGSPAGKGGVANPAGSGPGAMLRYAAGGAGGPGFPGSTAWNTILGRYWSHDYAQRVVLDPALNNDTHVWLIVSDATFREFTNLTGGVYQTASPSDEYHKLHRTAAGWELHELDGTVDFFDNAGLWTQTVDRNGNAKVGHYAGGKLASVDFPDRRTETFTYDAGTGKLASITEVGMGGAASRTWTYVWTSNDLTRITRPDGTKWEFFYGDAANPGWLTEMDLVGTDGSRRVDAAWQYDSKGNTIRLWRGDTSFTGTNAVGKWSFSFDNPSLPAVTSVTDPLGKVATFTIGRDTVSDKPRVTAVSGDCPACGLGPNTQLFYEDPANPLRPTRTIDGRGTTTAYTYNANGIMTSKTEAVGTPLERTTTWEYNGPFPALATRMEQPSTSGTGVRATAYVYDAVGNPTSRTISGVEAGSAFSYTTTTTFNTAGRPTSIDPPGYGAQDVTSYTYDSARGDLLVLTRTDPLVGTRTYSYDPFNRVASVTDPNGVAIETIYDALNRRTTITQKGATPAEDLVTSIVYDSFGDLFRTVLPRGNVVEYGYDSIGRQVTRERKASASTPGERTTYTLDAVGHHTREELQRWNGTAWVTDSATDYVYSSRCQLDKTIHPDGTVTEYSYDCEGNLERVWDANHPSANRTNPPTESFTYDVLNRMTSSSKLWGGSGGGTAATSSAYDVQDHLTQILDANGTVSSYVFGDRDLLTRETSEVSGITTYSYNEHGAKVASTDARNVTVSLAVDAADRVTFMDYPDNALDKGYVYDDPAVPFSKGRITAINRSGHNVAYTYDRFGRVLQDGGLAYTWDKNGNRQTVAYPGNVMASYTFDFADRPETLTMRDGGSPPQALVTAAAYKASGPLTNISLGNGLTESRGFNSRYFPAGIVVAGRLDWTFTTDAVGNVSAIADNLNAAGSRSFAYQDFQYFLTQGNGPWGTRSWTYDKIGNRLTETHDGTTDTYVYAPNAVANNSPRLVQISRGGGAGETSQLFYDAAGELTFRSAGEDKLRLTYGADQRLSQLRGEEQNQGLTQLVYDGRDLLASSAFVSFPSTAIPEHEASVTYSSDGWLYHRTDLQHRSPSSPRNQPEVRSDAYVFYFAGRPLALFDKRLSTPPAGNSTLTSELTYLTTDHLGAPILGTNAAGATVWQGGFEPFGEDWNDAQEAGIFLRFPGQWQDQAWENPHLQSGLYYNVHRWYEPAIDRYSTPDPLGVDGEPNAYLYARANPLQLTDAFGLSCTKVGRAAAYACCDGKGGFKVCKASELPYGQLTCLLEHEGDHDTWLSDPTNNCSDQCKNPDGTPKAEGECEWKMKPSQWQAMECQGHRLEYRCLKKPAGYSGDGLTTRNTRAQGLRNYAERRYQCDTRDWDNP